MAAADNGNCTCHSAAPAFLTAGNNRDVRAVAVATLLCAITTLCRADACDCDETYMLYQQGMMLAAKGRTTTNASVL